MEKIVDFYEYCPKCKHEKLKGEEEPCNECLQNPTNEDSRKPVKFDKKL